MEATLGTVYIRRKNMPSYIRTLSTTYHTFEDTFFSAVSIFDLVKAVQQQPVFTDSQ